MSFRLAFIFFIACGLVLTDMATTEAQAQQRERLIGGGRIMRKIFGIDSKPEPPKKSSNTKKPSNTKKSSKAPTAKSGKQPTLAKRPTASTRPQPKPKADPFTTNRSGTAARQSDAARTPSKSTRSSSEATKGFGMLVEERNNSLIVRQLDSKGNAAEAGVKRGDVIQKGGGVEFKSAEEFNQIAEILKDGDQLEFEIVRRGKEEKLLILFGKAPETPENEAAQTAPGPRDSTTARESLNRALKVNSKDNFSFLPTNKERRLPSTSPQSPTASSRNGMQSVLGNVVGSSARTPGRSVQPIQPLNPTSSRANAAQRNTTSRNTNSTEALRRQLQLKQLEIQRLRQQLKQSNIQTNDFEPIGPLLNGPDDK